MRFITGAQPNTATEREKPRQCPTNATLKRMLPRNEGIIIQAGSALAYRGTRSRQHTARRNTLCRVSSIRFGAN
jgi:hypothetical protein